MARKTKRYTHDGHTYEMYQLGGMQVAELSVLVLNSVAGILPLVLAAGDLGNVDVSKVKIDWKQVQPLLSAFAENCHLQGKSGRLQLSEDVFNEHFAGDLDGITELLIQGLTLNYASFLERRLGAQLNAVKKLWSEAAQSLSPSQTASPGTDGESSSHPSVAD